MVRGNWQKRVETAEARRRDAKQRKQRTEDKKAWKGWVQDLLGQLDQHESVLRKRQSTIHLWTDTLSGTSPPLLDLLEEEDSSASPHKRSSGRPRASSIESEGSAGGGRRPFGSKKKKVHPRSKEAHHAESEAASRDDMSDSLPLLMCQRHFLFNKCDGVSKKGGCKYFHYSSQKKHHLNLAFLLKRHSLAALQTAEEALLEETAAFTEVGAMDMLYYSSIPVRGASVTEESTSVLLSEELTGALVHAQTPLTSIVYVVVDDKLVFDRHQQGVLASGMEGILAVSTPPSPQQPMRPRQSSVGSEYDNDDDEDHVGTRLPGAVMEHILTFLPDTAVAACCQVCRSWNREIGQHSPNLWLHLLQRHDWLPPAPPPEASSEEATRRDASIDSRILFQKHYVAMRDMRALASAVPALLAASSSLRHASPSPSHSNNNVEEIEVTYQAFGSRKYAPHEADSCVSLEEWSPNHVLAGYAEECTLRLFQAVPFRKSEKRCKELVCLSVDPYKSTKKRTCSLDGVGLDEDTIGCLCHVSANNLDHPASAFVLVVLTRENFLLAESSAVAAKSGGTSTMPSEGELQVIDVGEAVLNYVLSSDVVDHRMLPLFDYLTDSGGEVGNITTTVSRGNIAACGYGRFMVEVSISIPNERDEEDDANEEGEQETTIQLDRKLVLFSASAQAIVWVGDSYPAPGQPPPPAVPAVLTRLRYPFAGGTRMACTIATAFIVSPSVLVCHIEPSGQVQAPSLVENSDVVRSSLAAQEGYETYPSRCLLVSTSDIIAKDTIYRTDENGERRDMKSTLTFFPRSQTDETASPSNHAVLHLAGLRIHDMEVLRDDYVILLCSDMVTSGESDDIGGQWFAPEVTRAAREVLNIVVVHIASRQEIGRMQLTGSGSTFDTVRPRLSKQASNTVALALGGLGVAMTGRDMRDFGKGHGGCEIWDFEDRTGGKPKKKKAGRGKKGSKKDGFARGMSLRG